MNEWQPRDTAPKDGTEFLGYSSRVGKCDVFKWSSHWKCFETTQHDGTYGPDEDEISIFDDFSHWMPLPPAPSETER